MTKWFRLMTIVILGVLAISGCGRGDNATDMDVTNRKDDTRLHQNQADRSNNRGNRFNMNNWDGRTWDQDLTRGNINTNRYGEHRNLRVEASEELAEKIAQIDGVKRAVVLLTDRNAYVGVLLDGRERDSRFNQEGRLRSQSALPQGLERKISQIVKSHQGTIRKVYVSANPDMMDRFEGFMERTAEGRPLEGLIHEFNMMMERIFPTRADRGDFSVPDTGPARRTERNGAFPNNGVMDYGDRMNRPGGMTGGGNAFSQPGVR